MFKFEGVDETRLERVLWRVFLRLLYQSFVEKEGKGDYLVARVHTVENLQLGVKLLTVDLMFGGNFPLHAAQFVHAPYVRWNVLELEVGILVVWVDDDDARAVLVHTDGGIAHLVVVH